ncbi:hypothetical protein [Lactococcus lactis]|uniref:hypothetical protein n=1 Tax=Lactococcus lactis TaxID=1358 RepID=UPI0021A55B4B|nr:hypothetical protein [Lactococcus lactis]MCT3131960.1 hypothetical protein [Lactococcus lactis]MDT2851872.1 hypothetical protein [Lactococcus lactis]
MNKEEIKKYKSLFWSSTIGSLISSAITIISFLMMNLKLGFIFMLLTAILLLTSYLSEFTSLKKEYKDNTVSFSVPSIIKKGYSVNPSTTKGKISWLTKFTFPTVLSLACIFALIVFYWD